MRNRRVITQGDFNPDPASHYAEPYDRSRKERNLWAVCLITGIMEMAKVRGHMTSDSNRRAAKLMAREWLMDDAVYVGSFVFCCEECFINPAVLRAKVLDLLKRGGPKLLRKIFSHLHTHDHRSPVPYGEGEYATRSKLRRGRPDIWDNL